MSREPVLQALRNPSSYELTPRVEVMTQNASTLMPPWEADSTNHPLVKERVLSIALEIFQRIGAGRYPFATRIEPQGAALGLETDFRPHFFGGVTTVVAKLFNQVTPDIALFGEKDYQQLAVIRQVVRDLNLPLRIVGAPTVREADGLAMSSRNRYLTETERHIAPNIYRALKAAAAGIVTVGDSLTREQAEWHCSEAVRMLIAVGFTKIDYVSVHDAETLAPIEGANRAMRLLAAAWLGKTRLIDNIAVE